MGVDNESATYISEEVARRTGVVTLPCLNFGWMAHYTDFPGTLDVMSETLKDLVLQVVVQLKKWGVNKVIFINGHGGNLGYLEEVVLDMREMGMFGPIVEWWKLAREITVDLNAEACIDEVPPPNRQTIRGTETAFALGISEDLVDRENIHLIHDVNILGDRFEMKGFQGFTFENGTITMPMKVREVSREGSRVDGPSLETSQAMVQRVVDYIVDFTKAFREVEVPARPSFD